MGTFGFRDVYIVTFWLYPSGLQPCVGLPLMELHMTSRTSPCTPSADPGSAAVVAHAAESSSGACTTSGITRCHSCGGSVAHRPTYSCCTNHECDSPYFRFVQPAVPATLEQFKGWLEAKAHAASQKVSGSSRHYPTPEELGSALVHAECRAAIKLLMAFEQEHSA